MPTTVLDDPLGLAACSVTAAEPNSTSRDRRTPGWCVIWPTGLVELIHPHGSARYRWHGRPLRAWAAQDGASTRRSGFHRRRRRSAARTAGAVLDGGPELVGGADSALGGGLCAIRRPSRRGSAGAGRGRHFNIQPQSAAVAALLRGRMASADHGLPTAGRRLLCRASACVGAGPAEDGIRATGAWSHQNFCWLLSTLGPLGSCEAAEAIGMSINVFRHRGLPLSSTRLRRRCSRTSKS